MTDQSQCSARLWLKLNTNGGGWAYCVDPDAPRRSVPSWAQFPWDIQITTNTSACPKNQPPRPVDSALRILPPVPGLTQTWLTQSK
jgi:hypothetical protein